MTKNGSVLLLHWRDNDAEVVISRTDDKHPLLAGEPAVAATFVQTTRRGELMVLPHASEEGGVGRVLDEFRNYQRKLQIGPHSLRFKTGVHQRLRPFLAGALFRPRLDATNGFEQLANLATFLRETLEVSEAVIVPEGWHSTASPPADASGAALQVSEVVGGDAGLVAAASSLREHGYVLGLAVPAARFDAPERFGKGFVGPVREGVRDASGAATETWENRLAVARLPWNVPALRELCQPRLLLLLEDAEARRRGVDSPRGRQAFDRYVREQLGLSAGIGGSDLQLSDSGYFEGLLDPTAWLEGRAWPLFPMAYSQAVRLTVAREAALRYDDAGAFLVHLLIGEVPLYDLPWDLAVTGQTGVPPAEIAGTRLAECFAQEDGWARGKGLSPQAIFLKNTYMAASVLSRWHKRLAMFSHRRLREDGSVLETNFGLDMQITVNLGDAPYEDEENDFVLPPYGFLLRDPFFLAFHASRINGMEYERPAFFVVQSLEGKMYLRAEKVHIYHGFGPSTLRLGGRDFTIEREEVTRIY